MVKLNWHEDFIVHQTGLVQSKVYVELGLYQCARLNRMIPYVEQSIEVDIRAEAGEYMQHSMNTRLVKVTTQELELMAIPRTPDLTICPERKRQLSGMDG